MITVLQILQYLMTILSGIIVAQAVLSLLVAFNVINTSNEFVRSLSYTLDRITEPVYRPIRRFMPDLGGVDLTPFALLVVLQILNNIVLKNMIESLAAQQWQLA